MSYHGEECCEEKERLNILNVRFKLEPKLSNITIKLLHLFRAITLILVLGSCTDNNESGLPVYDLVGLSEPETVLLSSVCDDIEYIPRETSDEILGNITGIRYSAGRYAIQSGSSISVFDNEGRKKYVLDKQGKGPEEYLRGSVFDFNGEKDEILVYDSGHKRILSYNEEVELVNVIKNISSVSAINLLADGKIFITTPSHGGDSKFGHVIINTDGDTLVTVENKFKFTPTIIMVFINECATYTRDERLFYHDLMDDTIFCVDKQFEISPHAVLNTGDLRFTVEKRTNASMTSRPDAIFVSDIIETDKHFFVVYGYNGAKHCLINKNTTENIVLKDEALHNDLDGGMPFSPDLLVDDKYLVQLVDAFEFNLWLESEHFKNFITNPDKKDEFRQLAERLTENDNPVLVRCRVK